jgi:hypothetical protein
VSINGSGRLDVSDNAIIVDYTGASPMAAVRTLLVNGRGTTGAPATWNGLGGIMSTAASPSIQGLGGNNNDGQSLSLGYAENSNLPSGSYSVFAGQTVDSSAILLRYTKGADANLDGSVGTSDSDLLTANFGVASSGQWFLGDFDYSGLCDNADATVLGALFESASPQAPAVPQLSPEAPSLGVAGASSAKLNAVSIEVLDDKSQGRPNGRVPPSGWLRAKFL